MKDHTPRNPSELRRQAEKRLSEKQASEIGSKNKTGSEDTAQTLHELRVHQIQLEMQNEELRAAEAEIKDGLDRYYDLYDLAPVGYCTLSEKGVILEANLAAATLLSTTRTALLEQPISRFIHNDDQDAYYLHRKKLFETGEPQECELRLVNPDGPLIWAHLTATAGQTEDGTPVCRVAISDITKRKRAEESLRESEALLSRSQEIAHTGSWKLDLTANRLTWSDEVYRIFGCKPQEFAPTYESFLDFVHPEDRAGVDEAYSRSVREGSDGYEIEHRIVRRNSDEVRHVHERCVHERDAGGTIIESTGMVHDITERKKAEAELSEQQALITAIYLNAPLVLMVVDAERRIRQVNDFASQFAGRPVEEMLGLRGGEALRCLHALDNPEGCEFGEHCNQCIIRNTVLDTLESGETHLQIEAPYQFSGEGEIREMTFLLSTTPLTVKDEQLALVTLQDITELKQAEAEHERLSNQLAQAQKMESVGRLAGGVAHDFNNMLSVIMGHTELALEDLAADNALRPNLEEIWKAATRSASLTQQLLAFARRQTISPRVLDLNETISSMISMLERLIGEDIDFLWKPGAELAPVRIDPGQVNQILANLVVNARDAIGHGNGKVTIETSSAQFDEEYCAAHNYLIPGNHIILAVSDNGCGMDEETRSHIFEPFFTTKGKGQGTGLGLATIYGIVKQNNGFINVYSEPGEGTSIRIYLPALEAESPKDLDISTSAAPVGGPETILIVEDEAAIRKMTRTILEHLGYTVLTAATPGEAIHAARERSGKLDLVITDVVMPEMNGQDLARRLQEYCPDIRVLFMSGYTADVISRHGILDENLSFIEKPFSQAALARKIRETLEK